MIQNPKMNDLKKEKLEKNIGLGFREITPRIESNGVPFFKNRIVFSTGRTDTA